MREKCEREKHGPLRERACVRGWVREREREREGGFNESFRDNVLS